jgi:4-hydroxybutyryl-CoA dehydratase/vinylacetyl-CoA-Delta-isomerase
MTDTKSDRSLALHQQKDPDIFLHVVEECKDGIVVCGNKDHQTGAGSPQAQRIMISRRINLKENQKVAKQLCGVEKGDQLN